MEIGTVRPVGIVAEMRQAYIDYAMSVITDRALPDVRDGLKPVQRRILYAMNELGLHSNTAHKKSARIVGEVLGKYHPHGEAAVYDTMVRLAQPFTLRYPLVDGQGNFGTLDDPAAAQRYTEARLSPLAEELLADIDRDTVNFGNNFDDSLREPTVLPGKLPNLMVNGSAGIAVGMATSIPPHNLNEVADAIIYMIDQYATLLDANLPFEVFWQRLTGRKVEEEALAAALKKIKAELRTSLNTGGKKAEAPTEMLLRRIDETVDIPADSLMEYIKGPDFPTGALIVGNEGIKNAYATGHGRITLRAKVHVEEMKGNRQRIIVSEMPYQVSLNSVQQKIADLVQEKKLEGISEMRDETDREGTRLVIELKRDVQPRQLINLLYKYTAMQQGFTINMLSLVDGQPRVLMLRQMLQNYIQHRKDVLTRRTQFELDRAQRRAHILEGLTTALDNIDAVIAAIRAARDREAARTALMRGFQLSEVQANAILDMQLARLAALERRRIAEELAEVRRQIMYLQDLLANPKKIIYLIKDDLTDLKQKYGDERRTKIVEEEAQEFTQEDLIPDVEVSIVATSKNYIKRLPADVYKSRRGARAEKPVIESMADPEAEVVTANMHDTLLLVLANGRICAARVHELPDSGTTRTSRGTPLGNIIAQDAAANGLAAMVPVRMDAKEEQYIVMVTRNGDVKRIAASEFSATRAAGVQAMSIGDGDAIIWAGLSKGDRELVLVSSDGQAIRFADAEVRPSGRGSGGVRAMRLGAEAQVVSVNYALDNAELVVASTNGYIKRLKLEEFSTQGRGGAGIRATNITPKTGPLAAACVARLDDEILLATANGNTLRQLVSQLPEMSRTSQGQVIENLKIEQGDRVATMIRLSETENPSPEKPSKNGSIKGAKATAKTETKPAAKTSAVTTRATAKGAASTAAKTTRTPKNVTMASTPVQIGMPDLGGEAPAEKKSRSTRKK